MNEQIREMCDTINEMYGADAMYYGVDSNAIAHHLCKAGYRKQSAWISVDERLPPKYETVLVFCDGDMKTDFICSWGVFYELDNIKATHWMPLPEAPKMKGGE